MNTAGSTKGLTVVGLSGDWYIGLCGLEGGWTFKVRGH
jgi:hypothetical protein